MFEIGEGISKAASSSGLALSSQTSRALWSLRRTWQVSLLRFRLGDCSQENTDIIVPRGIENKVAINMVVEHVRRTLRKKSEKHQDVLRALGERSEDLPLSKNVVLLSQTAQIASMDTILQNPYTSEVDFVFYFDRLATLLIERSVVRPSITLTPN